MQCRKPNDNIRCTARAVRMQEEHHGWKFRAVMSLEIGGNNSMQPLIAAAHLVLPVVDADTMGRAYPEAQMTSVAVGGLKPYPCALYDPRGIEPIVTQVPDWKWMERVSRKICVEIGLIASTCKAPCCPTTSRDPELTHALQDAHQDILQESTDRDR